METHGDSCRLGYLRLIALLADERIPKTYEYLSSLLYEITTDSKYVWSFLGGVRPIGVITNFVNARNYVVLATEISIINRRSQTLDDAGSIYARLDSSERFRGLIEGKINLGAADLITLNNYEKVFFLYLLLKHDYPLINEVLLWALEQRRFTRMEAMNYIMEEIYPKSLKQTLRFLDSKRREIAQREISESQRYREVRSMAPSRSLWIRTSLYAKYRHIAPPRLEWLIDLGILRRIGRGKYEVEENFRDYSHVFKKLIDKNEEFESEFFRHLPTIYVPEIQKASYEDVAHTLLNSYRKFAHSRFESIKLDLIELHACFNGLERGKHITPDDAHEVFNKLSILFPDRIFTTHKNGVVEVTKIDLTPMEI